MGLLTVLDATNIVRGSPSCEVPIRPHTVLCKSPIRSCHPSLKLFFQDMPWLQSHMRKCNAYLNEQECEICETPNVRCTRGTYIVGEGNEPPFRR